MSKKRFKNLIQEACHQHGVNVDFFIEKLNQYNPKTKNEAKMLLYKIFYECFNNPQEYNKMYEGVQNKDII